MRRSTFSDSLEFGCIILYQPLLSPSNFQYDQLDLSFSFHWWHHKTEFKLKLDSHIPKKIVLVASIKAFQEGSKMLFNVKSFFRHQNIKIFVLTFWWYRKNGLIRNIRLISNLMTSQPGQQTFTLYILAYIS